MTALKELGKNENIIITQTDKGGGVIIIKTMDYNNKMMELLQDNTTYTKKHEWFAKQQANKI